MHPNAPSRAGGRVITLTKDNGDTELIHLGLNPIGIDLSGEQIVFSTITPGPVYRVPVLLVEIEAGRKTH